MPLSKGRALKGYSYLTSGRTETSSLKRWITPTVQLAVERLGLLFFCRHCFGFIVREYHIGGETSGENYGQQHAHELPLPGMKRILVP